MSEAEQPLEKCPHCGAQHPEDVLICPNTNRSLPLPGRVIDNRFRFIRELGEGGMSTVWMAENFRVRKRVALKLMHPEYARNPRTLHRFQNEATAAGRIGNPHICDILDFGESPLGPYIVMEMLQGQSFAELLDTAGRIDPPLAVLIICEALKGLSAAHAVGIIHRDLKPENVFLHEPEPGRMLVKLMDFGISKFTEDPGGGRTGANVVMGTPEYMSPEQASGAANVDARTDIWAMGVMLYRAITGIEPFRGKTMAALLLALSTDDHEPVAHYVPGLAPELIAIIDRCLAKDPQQRFATADELYAVLQPFQQAVAEGERPQAPIRTGETMAVIPGAPGGPPVPLAATHGGHTVDVTAPTGPHQHLKAAAGSGSSPRENADTWSSELNPVVAPDQSWSMGKRTFHEDDARPYQPKRKRGGWVGWVVTLGVLGLLGGGGAFAWSAGLFGGSGKADEHAEGGVEEDTGTPVAVEEGEALPDLPAEAGGAGETGTETETGADETSEESGEEETDSGEAEGDADEGDGSGDSGGGSGGGSGGSGGNTNTTPPFNPSKLTQSGSLYTTKSRGPNGTWNSARKYCRSLKRKKRYGLTRWRMATATEIRSFGRTDVDRLLYWTSETSATGAKTVNLLMPKLGSERPLDDPAPRAFCVSKR